MTTNISSPIKNVMTTNCINKTKKKRKTFKSFRKLNESSCRIYTRTRPTINIHSFINFIKFIVSKHYIPANAEYSLYVSPTPHTHTHTKTPHKHLPILLYCPCCFGVCVCVWQKVLLFALREMTINFFSLFHFTFLTRGQLLLFWGFEYVFVCACVCEGETLLIRTTNERQSRVMPKCVCMCAFVLSY